jgi:hypothetical protein
MATSCSIEVTNCDEDIKISKDSYNDLSGEESKAEEKQKAKNFFLKLPALFQTKQKNNISTSKSCDRLSDKASEKSSRSRSTQLQSKRSTPEPRIRNADDTSLAKSASISSIFNFNLFKRSKNFSSSVNNIASIPGSTYTPNENMKCLGIDSVCFSYFFL